MALFCDLLFQLFLRLFKVGSYPDKIINIIKKYFLLLFYYKNGETETGEEETEDWRPRRPEETGDWSANTSSNTKGVGVLMSTNILLRNYLYFFFLYLL